MTQSQNNSIKKIIGLSIALIMLVGYHYTSAQWTNPPAGTVPPANNTPAPINIGTSPQSKFGNLGVIDLVASDYVKAGLQMWSPEYCDENGANCFSAVDIATTSGGYGQQVYSCPNTNSIGNSNPCFDGSCVGQIQTGSTCKDAQWSGGGGQGAGQCNSVTVNCTPIGYLVP